MKKRGGFRQVGDVHYLPSEFENICFEFNELALGLLVNRNVAQMWTNEEITAEIRYMRKAHSLPWSFR